MLSVKIGTINNNNNGSASDLAENDEVISSINSSASHPDYTASTSDSSIHADAAYWNAPLAKEVRIDAQNMDVHLDNFVDFDLNMDTSWSGVNIEISNAKRGELDTGSGNDSILISANTNSWGWSNLFNINTNDGNDTIIFEHSYNSQYTKLNIDAGTGNDIIDISGLKSNASSASDRLLNGGDGNDHITGSNGNEKIIGGTGQDIINAFDGDDIIEAGSGDDTINSGAGDDFIFGSYGNDQIMAGSGSDTVIFDASDSIVDGGVGLDALIIEGYTVISDNVSNFEAIIGQTGISDVVKMKLVDGLVVSLGGDLGDQIMFNSAAAFVTSDASLSSDVIEFVETHNVDINSLNAFESDNGQIVWTDVDLLA